MGSRKTFDVKGFLDYANKQLARRDEHATREFKMGVCALLEHVLMGTDNYRGYNYNLWVNGGCDEWVRAGEPDFPEKERFMYSEHGGEFDRVYY